MPKRLVFIHTVGSLVTLFRDLAKEIVPDVEIAHLVDETLTKQVLAVGHVTPSIRRGFLHLVLRAEEWDADLAVLTCSSISPAVNEVQPMVRVPLLRIDEAMADRAVQQGSSIGVIATAYTTLEPTRRLVEERALLVNKPLRIQTCLCEGAYDALIANDMERHDTIIKQYLRDLMRSVDVVVLAQASMARVADQLLESERRVPILSSPRLGVVRAKEILERP
jgi:aspartate/glutamate racemase